MEFLKKTNFTYNAIIAAAVLIHFYDLNEIFLLIKKKLKPNGQFIFTIFESLDKNMQLNSFLMYSHSHEYILNLANNFNFKIIYYKKDIHELHNEKPINGIVYILEKQT